MTNTTLKITPRDPLIARDGRPFGKGTRMKSLDWIRSSVVIGSLRTLVGKLNGSNFDNDTIEDLKKITIAGPFPYVNEKLYFPAPLDILLKENEIENELPSHHRLQPDEYKEGEGSTLPQHLRPAMMSPEGQFKPMKTPAFWSREKITEWLITPHDFKLPAYSKEKELFLNGDFINFPEKEERIHIKVCADSGAAVDGMFFSTIGLDSTIRVEKESSSQHSEDHAPLQMLARLDGPESPLTEAACALNHIHPCGGERRLVKWESCADLGEIWECPKEIHDTFEDGAKNLRMVLASSAIFENGWLPGWLAIEGHGAKCTGIIPGTDIEVQLISVVNGRWEPLSGWSYEHRSPKPISRMVPAGSVYFFKIINNPSENIAKKWLHSVCDDKQFEKDGFGLALWGTW